MREGTHRVWLCCNLPANHPFLIIKHCCLLQFTFHLTAMVIDDSRTTSTSSHVHTHKTEISNK